MIKKLLTVFTAIAISTLGFSQIQIQGDGGVPHSKKLNTSKSLDTYSFEEPDVEALRAEDEVIEETNSGPWRFGFNNTTNISMNNAGSWTDLPNGGKVWRARFSCENALTVNFTLENVNLPAGNEIYFYNDDKSFILGKITNKHLYEGQFGSELIPGSSATIEYYVAPGNAVSDASLTVEKVTHGYRTAKEFAEKAFGSSGGCNMDVGCPDGEPWEDQINSTVMLVSGGNGFCTGAMINNTLNDGTPYVLTANHCYSDPSSWVFRFNWQYTIDWTSGTCPTTGTEPMDYVSLSGAVLRSRRTPSDFCLVEITGGLEGGTVPSSYGAFFAGWDNSGVTPPTTLCVHHPSGDIKKIAFDDAAATVSNGMGSSEPDSQWEVEWDRNTTTEPGSSGSPLFDQNGRIIGQLWGGGASCTNLSAPDYYGRIWSSWEPAGSDQTNQLKYWLDPTDTGTTTDDGYDPNTPTTPDNAGINSIQEPNGLYCDDTFIPEVVLRNYGTNDITSVTINYDVDGGTNNTYNWTGTLTPGSSESIVLPSMTSTGGAHVFNASTSMPNGVADTDPANDANLSNFTLTPGGIATTVNISTDCWGYETYWRIVEEGTTTVVAEGGNLDVVLPGGDQSADGGGTGAYGNQATFNELLCLAEGCYEFEMYDDWGDGLEGTSAGCGIDGTYNVEDGSGTELVGMQNVNFGNNEITSFCVSNPCSAEFDVVTTQETCYQDSTATATVNFTTGNSTGATYDIGNGPQGSNVFTGLTAGDYTITIVDGDACTSIVPVTISGPAELTATATPTNLSCPGADDGSVSISASGGTSPYTYDDGTGAQTSAVYTDLPEGDYSYDVIDDNGCTVTTNVATVSSPAPLAASVTSITNESLGNDGAINITVTDGGTPYVYTWTGPGAFTATSEDVTGLASGMYAVTIDGDCGGQVVLDSIFVQDHTGIEENEAIDIVLYPNPSDGTFTLQLPNNTGEVAHIEVRDLAGRLVYSESSSNSEVKIELNSVATGTYIVRILADSYSAMQKVLLK